MRSNHQGGVALIQVLLMVSIMALIAIQFSRTARNQVSTSLDFKHRLEAEFALKSAESRVLFQLFSKDTNELSDNVIEGVKWNFRNKPFSIVEGADVSIQSHSGLLSLYTAPPDLIESVFVHVGAQESQAQQISASIRDWIDSDDSVSGFGAEASFYFTQGLAGARNGPMQNISELRLVRGMTDDLYWRVRDVFTIYPMATFNPALAPSVLVNSLFSEDRAALIMEAQSSGQFDERVWQTVMGRREVPYMDLHPLARFRVTMASNLGDVRLTRGFEVFVQSQKLKEPLLITARF